MSVLNQSGEEQVECPLCMEPLEVDDLNFFPCTCGYQICRFCWHRIRTDENGLCPACRKAYSENPADFTPLSKEQVAQLKAEKRHRDQQRKAKLSENRKHLANVRVVQKNLVFVVGLPLRLADSEVLKRHEYFGKFGKIHKVVINQSTSYAGSQGPSASAYVTYMKSDDALRAIQSVNNITIDGRLIKSSLGTTKYCSHFMKNQPCPKPDCMYLHDFGDPEASFTKEQMHAGKHQEYEKKLHEVLLGKLAALTAQQQQQSDIKPTAKSKETTITTPSCSSKDNWPQLNSEKTDKTDNKKPEKNESKDKTQKGKNKSKSDSKKVDKAKSCEPACITQNNSQMPETKPPLEEKTQVATHKPPSKEVNVESEKSDCSLQKFSIVDDNSSFFSQNSFQKIKPEQTEPCENDAGLLSETSEVQTQAWNDTLPVYTSEDWQAAFGFSEHSLDLAKQRNNVKDTLETFGNGFSTEFGKLDTFNNLETYPQTTSYSSTSKLQDNILDVLAGKSTQFAQNGPFSKPSTQEERLNHLNTQFNTTSKDLINGLTSLNGINSLNGVNGIDQPTVKFFSDFCKNGQKDVFNGLPNGLPNGLNGLSQQNGFLHSLTDRQNALLLQQRHIEEQLMSLNLKQQSYNQQLLQHNGIQQHGSQFLNGDVLQQNGQSYGQLHSQLYQNNGLDLSKVNSRGDDDLGFDPFHETQKGFAELIESEQNHKLHNTSRNSIAASQLNGMVHNQSGNGHLPPPPGFVQPNTHMNSFGSKILPYLNMGNSQQQPQQLNNITQNNWPGNYNQLQQQQQHKGLNTCNDWKVLDPAIVSSSRHFPLANMQIRDHFNPLPTLGTQQLQNGPGRSFDYPNYNNFNQIQPNYNNFSHINAQQNLNWLGNELNSQISSPPGFRGSAPPTKQQEC